MASDFAMATQASNLPGPAVLGPPLLDEGTKPYPSGQGYNAYPVIGTNTPGTYIDVSNSVTGGYSATAPGNTTAPVHADSLGDRHKQ